VSEVDIEYNGQISCTWFNVKWMHQPRTNAIV